VFQPLPAAGAHLRRGEGGFPEWRASREGHDRGKEAFHRQRPAPLHRGGGEAAPAARGNAPASATW